MATITHVPVTLTHVEANQLCKLLRDLSRIDFDHANRTQSAAIRAFSKERGELACQLEAAIVRRMFATSYTPFTRHHAYSQIGVVSR